MQDVYFSRGALPTKKGVRKGTILGEIEKERVNPKQTFLKFEGISSRQAMMPAWLWMPSPAQILSGSVAHTTRSRDQPKGIGLAQRSSGAHCYVTCRVYMSRYECKKTKTQKTKKNKKKQRGRLILSASSSSSGTCYVAFL